MKHLCLILFIAATVAACGGDEPADTPAADPTPEKPDDPIPEEVVVITADHSSPVGLATSIFAIAANGNYEELAGVAAPGADGDSKNVAGVAKASAEDQADFKSYFAKGKVSGPAKINGDRAEVPILFGPTGKRKETFVMVRRDGKWFLESF